MIFLTAICVSATVWFGTHLFFGKIYRTKALSHFALVPLQALFTWGVYSIPLLLIHMLSDNLPPNTGYVIFPILVTAITSSICGPLITLFDAIRRSEH